MAGSILRPAAVASALVISVTCVAGARAGDVTIVPHSATYSMSLSRVDLESAVFDFSGGLKINLEENCESWQLSQDTFIGYVNSAGQGTPTMYSHTAVEAKDGKSLTFATRRKSGLDRAARTESHGGRVETRDGQLVVTYEGEGTQVVLSRQTLFPVAHSRKLVEAALAGARVLTAREFSGSERMRGDVLVTAVIGNGQTAGIIPEGVETTVAEVLFSGTSWPVHLGYFSPEDGADVPEYEVSLRLHRSGAVSSLTLHYEALDIDLGLEEVSLNAPAVCP